jgi:cation transport ATPase
VQPGDPVYAGTTNLTGGIDITVTQVGAETTIGKVTQLIAEAERSKSPRQLLIEQVGRFLRAGRAQCCGDHLVPL